MEKPPPQENQLSSEDLARLIKTKVVGRKGGGIGAEGLRKSDDNRFVLSSEFTLFATPQFHSYIYLNCGVDKETIIAEGYFGLDLQGDFHIQFSELYTSSLSFTEKVVREAVELSLRKILGIGSP